MQFVLLKFLTFVLILFSAFYNVALSQVYNFRYYGIEDGLSQSQVYDFCTDVNGNMWIATYSGGLTVYNGLNSYYFNTDNGLPGNYVLTLCAAKDGKIWLGTTEGICCYDGQKFCYSQELKNTTIWDITEDKSGTIWIGSNKGLWKYKDEKYSIVEEFENEVVYLAYFGQDNNLYFYSAESGIVKYDGENYIRDFALAAEEYIINSLFVDSKNNLWLATSGGLFRYFNKQLVRVIDDYKSTLLNISSIAEDGKNRLWIGTYGEGLYVVENDTVTKVIKERNGLSFNKINCLFFDENKNLWVGTDGAGISILRGLSFINQPFAYNYSKTVIMAVTCGKDGSILLGSDGAGFVYYKTPESKAVIYNTGNGLVNNSINAIVEDKGKYWICTEQGVSLFKDGQFCNYPFRDSVENLFVMDILKDSNGNYWIGTNGHGLFYYNDADGFNRFEHEFLDKNAIWYIYETRKGELFFATENGLLVKDNTGLKTYTIKDGLNDNSIWSIDQDKRGRIWLGTDNGINVMEGDTFKSIKKRNGLSSNIVFILKFDDHDNLWVGSEKGVDKISFSAKGEIDEVRFFGKKEGFTSIECNSNAVDIDNKGNIWFGTVNGVMIYDHNEEYEHIRAPKTYISNIKLFYENVNWNNYADSVTLWNNLPVNLVLPYKQNNLTFEFVGIDYAIPEKVKFKYILEGADKKWSPETHQNYERYSNLPPGDYVFKVIASDHYGNWSKKPAEFYFKIKAPFWQTIWFYLFCFIISVLTVVFYTRLRTRRLEKARKILEQTVEERTHEINQQNIEIINQRDEIESQRDEILSQRDLVTSQKNELEKIHEELKDSILYAKKIQKAMMPESGVMKQFFTEHFIFFKPKDIVSGDFYWVSKIKDKIIVAVADCTGHGVPGAFMSMMGISYLNDIIRKMEITQANMVLNELRENIISALNQKDDIDNIHAGSGLKDGMDFSLCVIDTRTNIMQYSGANNPIYIVSKKTIKGYENRIREKKENLNLYEIKPDRMPIAIYRNMRPFTNHTIQLSKSDIIYMFTDGYTDQFGGSESKKFMHNPFRNIILNNAEKDLNTQKYILNETFEKWRNNLQQVDDITILGFKI